MHTSLNMVVFHRLGFPRSLAAYNSPADSTRTWFDSYVILYKMTLADFFPTFKTTVLTDPSHKVAE